MNMKKHIENQRNRRKMEVEGRSLPVTQLAALKGIEASQCTNCYTIYPHIEGSKPTTRCRNENCTGHTKAITIDIHYPDKSGA
jgi:hypothetical protein